MIYYLAFLISVLISVLFAPLYIKFAKKVKFGQNILHYVSEHQSKQGTPTMGGIIFILPTILVSLFFMKSNLAIPLMCLSVFLAYAVVGFLDDYIKIKYKRNMGLRAYQKIIFQLLIAFFVAVFIYRNFFLSGQYLPFTFKVWDLKAFVIPFVIFVFLACTNSVNLTDGLDGLAGGISFVFFIIIAFISVFYVKNLVGDFEQEYAIQMQNINVICFSVAGSLLGFLLFNSYPAKIFMGDTGSLALGALMACVCCMNGTSLYIPIIGVMFVVSSVSVIMQVVYFKRTRKRFFLMSPYHHHLEHKGMYETKIVFIYIFITMLIGITILALLGIV
ncbi:MAG: phospho-N-acetylmuramoyl-pentapeptide-transferase [Clostridia bacterium]|nr:phospho-N-acetylmuramoyl-pentapeptide-transferase [Clostridia bacterium]